MWGPSGAEWRFMVWMAVIVLVSVGVGIGLLFAWLF